MFLLYDVLQGRHRAGKLRGNCCELSHVCRATCPLGGHVNIKKIETGKYQVDARPQGAHGKRVIRTFTTRREAVAFLQHLQSQVEQGKEWQPKKSDRRSLSDLAKRWYDIHGKTLKAGHKRLAIIDMASAALGVPAQKVTANQYMEYRNKRLDSGTHAKTLNNELGFINAVYNKLHDLDVIKYSNPLAKVKPLKIDERELSWLKPSEIEALLRETSNSPNKHVTMITLVCLNTGARWSEAETLKPTSVKAGAITYSGTKSGKNRTIPIAPEFEQELLEHFAEHGAFTPAIDAFRNALKRSELVLPKGQASHVLRHTFAAHFVMRGGNILTLQKILGHSTVAMTMRYAHLSPEHLREAINLNPMAGFKKGGKKVESLEG